MASKKLRKIQIGFETVKGTLVAATDILRVPGTIEDVTEVTWPEEDVGRYAPADRAYISKNGAKLEIEDTSVTFEQTPIFLSLGLDDIVSGTADGAGTDKIYDYALPNASDLGFKTATFECGDDAGEEEFGYGFLREFTLKGVAGEAWMFNGIIEGQSVVPSTYTGALTLDAVEDAIFVMTKLYIDASGGAIGTTLKANTLIDAELKVDTGLRPVLTADGVLSFSFVKRVGPDPATLQMTFEHDGVAIAEKAAWRSRAIRLVQLKCEGSAVVTGGTLYQKRTMIIKCAGIWEKFEKIDENEGNDVVRGTLRLIYSPADALYGNIIFVNEKASLP